MLCCETRSVTLVVVMILKNTATFQALFIASLFCANITTAEINSSFYLKVEFVKCLCLLPVILVLVLSLWSWSWSWSWSGKQRCWSWSCHFGLGLGLGLVSIGLGLGLVTLVVVLRIWSYLHHGSVIVLISTLA